MSVLDKGVTLHYARVAIDTATMVKRRNDPAARKTSQDDVCGLGC